MDMNAIFMGTPEFAVESLEVLYKSEFDIKLVITQPDRRSGRGKKLQSPAVKLKAIELGLEVFQPESIKTADAVEKIKLIDPDIIIVVAFGQILTKAILDIPRLGCINVHASLLPKYRGAAPINYAIINGEEKTGVTTMYMDVGLDTGDMIISKSIDIGNDDAQQLTTRLSVLGGEVLDETLKLIVQDSAPREKQSEEKVSYAPVMSKSFGIIDWNRPSKDIVNLIKGTYPWPSAYTHYNGETLKILSAESSGRKSVFSPGTISDITKDGIYVSTLDEDIKITELQQSGKKRLMVSEFLKGNTVQRNVVLGNE